MIIFWLFGSQGIILWIFCHRFFSGAPTDRCIPDLATVSRSLTGRCRIFLRRLNAESGYGCLLFTNGVSHILEDHLRTRADIDHIYADGYGELSGCSSRGTVYGNYYSTQPIPIMQYALARLYGTCASHLGTCYARLLKDFWWPLVVVAWIHLVAVTQD